MARGQESRRRPDAQLPVGDRHADGLLDRFDDFDSEGRVQARREDLNGDRRIDVRSVYERGKLVLREFADPAFAPRHLV